MQRFAAARGPTFWSAHIILEQLRITWGSSSNRFLTPWSGPESLHVSLADADADAVGAWTTGEAGTETKALPGLQVPPP